MPPDQVPPTGVGHPRARGQPRRQVVDPAVSRAKFDRELGAFHRHEAEYRRRGWFLLSADFPRVLLLVTAPQLRPAPVLFGVSVDFQNYDIEPLSVRLVDPWTGEVLRMRQLVTPLPRVSGKPDAGPVAAADEPTARTGEGNQGGLPRLPAPPDPGSTPPQVVPLMQAPNPDAIPFLCTRGVREYHRHPAHTGDSWLLHRRRGEGTVSAILDAIDHHGRAPIQEYLCHFEVQWRPGDLNVLVQQTRVRVAGFMNLLEEGVSYPSSF